MIDNPLCVTPSQLPGDFISLPFALQDCKSKWKELDKTKQKVKQLESQLERERAKSKAMMKQIKESGESDGHVVWFGLDNKPDSSEKTEAVRSQSSESRPVDKTSKRAREYKAQVKTLQEEIERLKTVRANGACCRFAL